MFYGFTLRTSWNNILETATSNRRTYETGIKQKTAFTVSRARESIRS